MEMFHPNSEIYRHKKCFTQDDPILLAFREEFAHHSVWW